MRWWLIGAGINGIMGVGLAAMAAHGLNGGSIGSGQALVKTGANYQLWHAAALVGIGAWWRQDHSALLAGAGWLLGIGALLFASGLYLSALDLPAFLRFVAPVGGVALIVGWGLVIVAGCVRRGERS